MSIRPTPLHDPAQPPIPPEMPPMPPPPDGPVIPDPEHPPGDAEAPNGRPIV